MQKGTRSSPASLTQQHWRPIVFFGTLLVSLIVYLLPSPEPVLPPYILSAAPPVVPPRTGSELHLLIPLSTLPPPSLIQPKETPPYCKTILTSLIQGFQPIVLDLGTPDSYHAGLNKKIDVMAEWLEQEREQQEYEENELEGEKERIELEEDVLLMIDGWDVLLVGTPEEVLENYRRKPNQILLGADKTCWPLQHEIPCLERPHSPHPESWYSSKLHEPPRYFTDAETHLTWTGAPSAPNSGVILGPVSLLANVYSHFTSSPSSGKSYLHPDTVVVNDQERFVLLYYTDHLNTSLSGSTSFHTEIDFDSAVSGNMVVAYEDWDFPSPTSNESPRWTNRKTGEQPPLVHFNGRPNKILLEEVWRGLWWVREPEVRTRFEGHEVGEDGKGLGVWIGGRRAGEGEWREWKSLGCEGVWNTAPYVPPKRMPCSADDYYHGCRLGDLDSVTPFLSTAVLCMAFALAGVLVLRFVFPGRWVALVRRGSGASKSAGGHVLYSSLDGRDRDVELS